MVYLAPAPLSRTCTAHWYTHKISTAGVHQLIVRFPDSLGSDTTQVGGSLTSTYLIIDQRSTLCTLYLLYFKVSHLNVDYTLPLYCSMCAPLRRQLHNKIQYNNHPPLRGATALQWQQYIALHYYAKEDLYLSRGPLHNPTPKISSPVHLFIVFFTIKHAGKPMF